MNKKVWSPNYWICLDCAKERGATLPDDYIGTVMKDVCKCCGLTCTLIPYVDFIHKESGQEPIDD